MTKQQRIDVINKMLRDVVNDAHMPIAQKNCVLKSICDLMMTDTHMMNAQKNLIAKLLCDHLIDDDTNDKTEYDIRQLARDIYELIRRVMIS